MNFRFIFLFLGGVLFCSCSFATGHHSPSLKEIEAARTTFEWLENRYGFLYDPEVSRLVTKVTKRISTAIVPTVLAGQIDSETAERYSQNYPWQVFILDTPETNAFSASTGLIFVTRGLIRSLDSEAAFASVIAHEMAHEILGHTYLAGTTEELSTVAPQFVFSLNHELAADSLAVGMLKVARYDIREIPYALSIVYRPIPEVVSGSDQDIREIRLSALEALIAEETDYLPATQNTRQFNRMRRHL